MSRNIFNSISLKNVGSSNFDLSHDRKMSLNFGNLTPCMVQEVLPGDVWNLSTQTKLRFAPLVSPVMHRANVFIHYFYVPNRIVWPNFDSWIWDPESTNIPPTIAVAAGQGVGTLSDYLGLPVPLSATRVVSALPYAAYQCIYNEYYRDQNLITPVNYVLGDGAVGASRIPDFRSLRKRSWMKDYFTAALPFAQRGPEVLLPIQGTAPVNGNFHADQSGTGQNVTLNAGGNLQVSGNNLTSDGGVPDGLYADLTQATSSSIRDLRRSIKLQEWFERSARGGARATEALLSFFGVKAKDARLNRPEYLGGVKEGISISEVLQTSETTDDGTPQGTMSGHGLAIGSSGNIRYTCPEHGYIMGIMSVMPVPAYQQGIPRHFIKQDQFDYAWPTLQHIGEQEVRNVELYEPGPNPAAVFGYVPRNSEYKYQPSTVHGDFKTTLNHWHMGRIFSSEPALNQTFIEMSEEEVNRIFAVAEGDKLWAHVMHNVNVRRKLSFYANPGL